MSFPGLGKPLLAFLGELKRNNNREWFTANKERFERDLRKPAFAFIEAIAPRLAKISPHIAAVAAKSGGSMMRLNRDVRFSKDKSPYNTHVGIRFVHARGEGHSLPGYYAHITPGGSFLGAGLWQPEPDMLARIRKRIVDRTDDWAKVARDAAFRRHYGEFAGESLKRPPQGFPPEHPFIDDLKRKDFVGFSKVDDKDVASPAFLDTAARTYEAARPLVAFLCEAVNLPF